jgi:hypothetical protein
MSNIGTDAVRCIIARLNECISVSGSNLAHLLNYPAAWEEIKMDVPVFLALFLNFSRIFK